MNGESIAVQLENLLKSLLSELVLLVPRIIVGLLIILAGWILARVVQKLIIKLFLYLDGKLNTWLRSRYLSVDLQSSAQFIGKTVFWIIVLISIAIVSQILGLPVLTTWFDGLVGYLPNILAAVVILFAGIIVGRLLGDLIGSTVSRTGVSKTDNVRKFIQFVVLFIAAVIAIDQIGIDIQFLTNLVVIVVATLLFGAALAFGFGARTSVSNILGSYYVQKTYQEGNTIQIGDITGVIVKITPTAVYLKTESGLVTIPAKNFNEEKSVLLKES